VDEGDPRLGAALHQQVGGEGRSVVDVEALGQAIGRERLLEDLDQDRDGLVDGELPAHDHPAVVVDEGTQDRLAQALAGHDRGAVQEVADPQLVDLLALEALAHVAAPGLGPQPFAGHRPQQRVVAHRRVAQLVARQQVLVQALGRPVGVGLALAADGGQARLAQAPGPALVGPGPGLEPLEAALPVAAQPELERGHAEPTASGVGELMLLLGLAAEVLVLHPPGLGEHRADQLVAGERDLLAGFRVHAASVQGVVAPAGTSAR